MTAASSRPLVGVGVVFAREGRVFLAQRKGELGGGSWGSAGGHLEFGETLEDCARREAREEFGVEVGEVRYLCVSNIIAYRPTLPGCGVPGGDRGSGAASDGAGRF